MKISTVKCPSCGGSIKADLKNKKHIFCTYCGQQLHIDDGTIEVIHTYNFNTNNKSEKIKKTIDVAKIEEEKTSQKATRVFLIIFILYIIFMIIQLYGDTMGDSIKEYINKKNDKVCVGSSRSFINENYEYVQATLESAGFTNIELIDLDDQSFFKKDGDVTNISIGGKSNFSSNDYFNKDEIVVITYH